MIKVRAFTGAIVFASLASLAGLTLSVTGRDAWPASRAVGAAHGPASIPVQDWPQLWRDAQRSNYTPLRPGQWARAERALREALQLAQSMQWQVWVSSVSIELGKCLLATGQLDEVNRVCAAALAGANEGGHNDTRGPAALHAGAGGGCGAIAILRSLSRRRGCRLAGRLDRRSRVIGSVNRPAQMPPLRSRLKTQPAWAQTVFIRRGQKPVPHCHADMASQWYVRRYALM